jgi:hypothetical protein
MHRVFHPQLQQLMTLFVLLALGQSYAHIHVDWIQTAWILAFAGMVEHLLLWVRHQKITYISYASFSTAIGVMLMLVTSTWWIYGVVIVLALAQKHLIQIDNKHFFNPSNFALMMGMVLFYNQAHVVLGQLGDAFWLRWLVAILAGLVLVRVRRWVIPLVFIGSYLAFEYLLVVRWDPVMTFEDVYSRFYAVSFVVFVMFMLTDPRTTPSRMWQQVVFGVVIAVLASWLDRWHGFRVQHLFMVLFVLSPWVPWLESPKDSRQNVLRASMVLFLLAMGAIIFLEIQPPYYFEMEG